MATLSELFDVLSESLETSTPNEIKSACKLIIEVQDMSSGERDCIRAAFRDGPLLDGDVPCKSSRTALVEKGYMAKVIVSGMDGYNACTYKGMWAYKLIVLEARKDP